MTTDNSITRENKDGDEISLGRVISVYESAYPDPLVISAGETVTIGERDNQWPDFVWCTNQAGQEGWVPESYLDRQGGLGVAGHDYEATELSVAVGEALMIEREAGGWVWATNRYSQSGWVPAEHLKLLRAKAYFIEEQAVAPFDFVATAEAHGWVVLRPFEWTEVTAELCRLHQLDSGQVVRLRLQGSNNRPNPGDTNPKIEIRVETNGPLTKAEQVEIGQAVRRMLRLNEDLSEFYRLSRQMDGWTLHLQPGGGRLLRCPNLFEDIVYTLCTTNIAWSGTIRMVDRLTAKLGRPFLGQDDWRAFPGPAAIAAAGPEFLKQEIGLGYRSGYVWELASAVAEGRLDLTAFEDPNLSIQELHRALRQIKGVGDYAAATILMLLGRYEYLAIDSEMRAFVSRKYFNGQAVSDSQIQDTYAPWGRWQYLAYWFDAPQNGP